MFFDITGERFDRLLAIEFIPHAKQDRGMWLVKCDCGNERLMESWALRHGKNKSCGRHRIEQTIIRSTKHGQARRGKKTPEYARWKNLRSRKLTNLDFTDWQQKELQATRQSAPQVSAATS